MEKTWYSGLLNNVFHCVENREKMGNKLLMNITAIPRNMQITQNDGAVENNKKSAESKYLSYIAIFTKNIIVFMGECVFMAIFGILSELQKTRNAYA